jgi:hypothetical protein
VCGASHIAEKLYPEKSDKVYGIDSSYSSVSTFFVRKYPKINSWL